MTLCQHPGGRELPDRDDGLHWLECVLCGREWAEYDSGKFAKGSKICTPTAKRGVL